MVSFSHRHVYSAFLQYPMSIRAIESICPQAILLMSVTLFSSGMLGVTKITSINVNDTMFCLEFNGECAGESIMSLRFIFLLYDYVNLENKSIL